MNKSQCKLTQCQLKQLLHYDPDTGVFTWVVDLGPGRPNAGDVAGREQVKKSSKKYRDICIRGKRYYAHRLAYLYMTGENPANEIDHINGNGVDNRWCNLRSVTTLENSQNTRQRPDNTSGVTGVHRNKLTGKWEVFINSNRTRHYLGLFSDFFEAVCARKSAEVKHGFHVNHGSVRPL